MRRWIPGTPPGSDRAGSVPAARGGPGMRAGTSCRWRRGAGRWLGLVLVVSAFLGGAAAFLPHQALWIDEATQRSGLTLGPAAVARWLAGEQRPEFGQYPDRMPPLSYWLGWAWSRVVGPGEGSLRWFGVVCAALAVALVYEGARRVAGVGAAWVAGLICGLSPAVIVLAVEVRAYPLFLLWSAAAFRFAIGVLAPAEGSEATPVGHGRPWSYAGLALALALAILTHFYGVVLAGAILTALVIELRPRAALRGKLPAVVGIVALAVVGITPFLAASMRLYGDLDGTGPGPGGRLIGAGRLLPRLITHPTLSVQRPAAAVAVTAAAILLAAALGLPRPARQPGRAIAWALAAGLAAITAARLVFDRFDASSTSYNAWMLPGLYILLATGLAASSPAARGTAAVAAGLLLAAQFCGVYQLAAHGDYFAHGPHRRIAAAIRAATAADLAVVHDDASRRIDYLYRPLRYEFGPRLPHYRFAGAAGGRTVVQPYPDRPGAWPATALPHRYLLVVRSRFAGTAELAEQVRHGDRPLGAGPIARELHASPAWHLRRAALFVASDTAEVRLFERRAGRIDGLSPAAAVPAGSPPGPSPR